MNNIKTYEVFKDWFKKKKEPVSILNYEDQIEYFLDDQSEFHIF